MNAKRRVEDCRVLFRSTKAKPDAAYGVDQWVGVSAVYFAPESADVHIDDIGRRIKMQVPDVLQQHAARDDLPLVVGQVGKQLELAGQQLDRAARVVHGARQQVDIEIADT